MFHSSSDCGAPPDFFVGQQHAPGIRDSSQLCVAVDLHQHFNAAFANGVNAAVQPAILLLGKRVLHGSGARKIDALVAHVEPDKSVDLGFRRNLVTNSTLRLVIKSPCADVELVDSYESKRAAQKDALIFGLARKQYTERDRFIKAYE